MWGQHQAGAAGTPALRQSEAYGVGAVATDKPAVAVGGHRLEVDLATSTWVSANALKAARDDGNFCKCYSRAWANK